MQIVLLPAQTGATTKTQFSTHGLLSAVISASGLATTERVDLFRNVAGTWVEVVTSAGAAVSLAPVGTSPGPSYRLEGGTIYAFDKDVTAGASAVVLDIIPNQ